MSKAIVSDPRVMGGAPCFEGTRIPFDTVAQLIDYRTIFPEEVPYYYPSLTVDDVQAALNG